MERPLPEGTAQADVRQQRVGPPGRYATVGRHNGYVAYGRPDYRRGPTLGGRHTQGGGRTDGGQGKGGQEE
eukprot:6998853-Lingulodinium_polyedra.AAC.1